MAGTITYTKRLGKAVAQSARVKKARRFHIVSSFRNDGWSVLAEGSVKPLRAFSTKQAAILYARQAAPLRSIQEVIVHEKDGGIQDVISI